MTYQINNTSGAVVTTIPDGYSDNTLSITLVGRKYAGYGEILQENLVKMLEHFSNNISPSNATAGQIWYDSVNKLVKYYDGSAWQTTANVIHLSANINSLSSTLTTAMNSNVSAINANIFAINANVTAANLAISSLNTLKAPLASPALTGSPTAPTATHLVANTQIATTQFVRNELGYYSDSSQLAANVSALITRFDANIASNVNAINANIALTNANVTAANAAISSLNALKAPLASPTLTGTPVAPTANISVASTQLATTQFVHNILPLGVVIMWSGNVSSIPYGWALCDGNTYGSVVTPNLSNRFIVAQGATYTQGTVGGSATATPTMQGSGVHNHGGVSGSTILTASDIPSHTHSVAVTGAISSHTHGFKDVYAIVGDYGLGGSTAGSTDRYGNYIYPSFYAGDASDGDYDNGYYGFDSLTDAANPSLTVSVTETAVGGGQGHSHFIGNSSTHVHNINTFSIIPPYYALCYIMKVV